MPPITRDELETGAEIVYRHMAPTAQIHWPLLSERTGAEVWVKHENQTSIGAFKIRGGLVYMTRLKKDQPDCPGVVTATRGNHGQSVALAAAKVGLEATILVPYGNNLEKNAAMRAFGAELIEHGDDFQEAHEYAVELGQERGLHIIPPFHARLVQGVGTYAIEFLSTVHDLDTVYVPIGQGSGICGLISARDALGMRTEVVGVVAENAPCYALSFKSGVPVSTNSSDTLADGMACRVPVKEAVDIIQTGAERVLTLSEDELLNAMNFYYTDTHNAAEGAGAAPLAGLIKERDRMAGKKVGLILSGGNADKALFVRALSRS
ncbi:MAG: threonine dehydratase [Pseudomonadota bacterium]|nr:threonine dehydratase [Pseudomonadota bacterium]